MLNRSFLKKLKSLSIRKKTTKSDEMESSTESNSIKRPSLLWSLTEGGRAIVELGTYLPYRFLNKIPKTGDGHPVLILPGFMATDFSTVPLRSFIYDLGYKVYGWGEGRNFASIEYLELLLEKIDMLYDKHGMKISLIGWSLGGVYARQLAKERPNKIRQVITMGSPFKGITKPNNAKWMYNIITKGKGTDGIDPELLADIPHPAPVPTTAIYSKQDGVVPWEMCKEDVENKIHQNIEVRGSHLGLGVNPSVLQIIADRLQYAEENWCHFEVDSSFQEMLFYPAEKDLNLN